MLFNETRMHSSPLPIHSEILWPEVSMRGNRQRPAGYRWSEVQANPEHFLVHPSLDNDHLDEPTSCPARQVVLSPA